MKKFFSEFKTFITRGNVIDLAVGMIIGAAFTAIVNALVNGILKPLINAIPMGDVSGLITMLVPKNSAGVEITAGMTGEEAVIDLTKSVYINWGDFIMAIITFLLTAFVLFLIVKVINSVRSGGKRLAEKQKKAIEKKRKKGEITDEEAAKATAEAEAPAAPVVAAVTAEELLTEIRDLLKAQNPAADEKEEK